MGTTYRVLLLDDNKASNYIHSKYLQKANEEVEVIEFQSGREALNYIENESNPLPDAFFIDINMPTMNAFEFFDRLQAIDRSGIFEKRIFLLTTSASKFDLERSQEYDFLELIVRKPLDLSKIRELELVG